MTHPDMERGEAASAHGPAPKTTHPLVNDPSGQPSPFAESLDDDEPETFADIVDAVFDGTAPPVRPRLLTFDGERDGLLYGGSVHWLAGLTESGKSWIGCHLAAEQLRDGGNVSYIDFEGGPHTIVGRLRALGVSREDVRDLLVYRRPTDRRTWRNDLAALRRLPFDVAIVDGVTEGIALEEANANDAGDVAAWVTQVPGALARDTGAAVLCIDHMPRVGGRHPTGSLHKLATVDGAAYVVSVEKPIGIGRRGVLTLRVAKDRPGAVRAQCADTRSVDALAVAGRVVFDATAADGTMTATVLRPTASTPSGRRDADDERKATAGTTDVMERVSQLLETAAEPMSQRAVRNGVVGSPATVSDALRRLVEGGFVDVEERVGVAGRTAHLHRSARPFRVDVPEQHGPAVPPPPLRGGGAAGTTQAAPTDDLENHDTDRVVPRGAIDTASGRQDQKPLPDHTVVGPFAGASR